MQPSTIFYADRALLCGYAHLRILHRVGYCPIELQNLELDQARVRFLDPTEVQHTAVFTVHVGLLFLRLSGRFWTSKPVKIHVRSSPPANLRRQHRRDYYCRHHAHVWHVSSSFSLRFSLACMYTSGTAVKVPIAQLREEYLRSTSVGSCLLVQTDTDMYDVKNLYSCCNRLDVEKFLPRDWTSPGVCFPRPSFQEDGLISWSDSIAGGVENRDARCCSAAIALSIRLFSDITYLNFVVSTCPMPDSREMNPARRVERQVNMHTKRVTSGSVEAYSRHD